MTYEQKASEIIKNSIKSAIFIDENARTFFQKEDTLVGKREEKLSKELFENFKNSGISLAIHKYQIGDESDSSIKNYLFEDRDLVLLDWNLDGENEGQEYSLKLLANIIERPHIHFCTIYTSESGSKLDDVYKNILSYFSGKTEEYYDEIKELLELNTGITQIKSQLDNININRHSKDIGKHFSALMRGNKTEVDEILKITGESDKKCAIIKASIALGDTLKSTSKNPCPSVANFESKTLIIDNTIITIFNKDENNPSNLINNISKHIIEGKSSFTQLLGLEMQTIFSNSSAFIDENSLRFSKDTIIYHREKFKKEGHSHFFPEFIKEIMLEKAKLNIRNKSIALLEDEFLDSENKSIIPKDEELISMNVFYNSTKLKNDNKLNFGDVFKKEDSSEFYICITALCDCLRPDKIDNKFFFAKGEPISKEYALKLGDTAFISYLDNKQIVKWTSVSSIEEALHKFSPVYIKPIQQTVVNTDFDNNTLKFLTLDSNGDKVGFKGEYVTTIKSNYTQRIANHAFNHPVRVGVDFVKI